MTSDAEWQHILQLLRDAAKRDRGYASFFDWPEREQKEAGIALDLFEALAAKESVEFSSLVPRGQGNDPPDCEAVNLRGRRLGIEVTELVDADAIRRRKTGHISFTATWNREKFFTFLDDRFTAKDRPSNIKGGPYDEYWLLVYCDEPELPVERAAAFLAGTAPRVTKLLTSAFLLFSYSPQHNGYPYLRLSIERAG